jgi:hypothetical protein
MVDGLHHLRMERLWHHRGKGVATYRIADWCPSRTGANGHAHVTTGKDGSNARCGP